MKRNKEATHDVCVGYGIAAVLEFKASLFFPKLKEIDEVSDLSNLLLKRFKDFLYTNSQDDAAFSYRAEVITFWAPLQEWFYDCIASRNGIQREAVWMLLVPVFAQMHKRNYFAEGITYCVNYTSNWALAIRKMVQQNCSINVSGGDTSNHVAIDEDVETFTVQPLKSYTTGKTTLKVLKVMSASFPLLQNSRSMYLSKSGLDIHNTRKHSVPTSFPDQLIVAWFCLSEKFYQHDSARKKALSYPYVGCSGEYVRSDKYNIYSKGVEKIKLNFQRNFMIFFLSTGNVQFSCW